MGIEASAFTRFFFTTLLCFAYTCVQFSHGVDNMENPAEEVSSIDTESTECTGASCAVTEAENSMSCSSADVPSNATVFPPRSTSDDASGKCKNGMPADPEVDTNCNVLPVISPSQASPCDEGVSSHTVLPCNAESLADALSSVVDDVQLCSPIISVAGSSEDDLKRGLEQRLGLVLSKLARESDEDVDEELQFSQPMSTACDDMACKLRYVTIFSFCI